MKIQLLAIHGAWALVAAGAWWFGHRLTVLEEGSKAESQNRLKLAIDANRTGPDTASKIGGTAAASANAETTSWLQKWGGASGVIPPENMTAALTEAMQDPDSVRGLRHFTHLLECLTSENAPAALATLRGHTASRESRLWLNLFCATWGAKDGTAAMAGAGNNDERGAALAGWARVNSAAAKEWLAALPKDTDSDDRRRLERSLIQGMARTDPQGALDYIANSNDRGDLVRILTREQMANGIPATARWASELKDSEMRGPALEAIARHYMHVDPVSGAAWAAESSTAPDMRDAVGRVADRMAENDVLAAWKWAQQLPPSPGREEAWQQVFSEWARKDPTASSQELLRIPAGPQRDNAVHSFAGSLVRENPQDAMTWAAAIGDPGLRLETQIDVARKWNESSPGAAQAWIVANLPPEARVKALTPDD
ncbi:MAG TPA: hypothetical protein VG796_19285 [Verrucomicrobiales bacterium]|nr:hypothetical protein [Verrucomicrobiales bacterium]